MASESGTVELEVLKKSRRSPGTGDIFALKPVRGDFLFGRVISTEANPLGVGGGVLVYIYSAQSNEKSKIPQLHRENLLIPPLITNKLPWSRGYFEFLANLPLEDSDRFPRHCFVNSSGWYFDETGVRLTSPIAPVGQWGLHSYASISDEIARALNR